jgi:hypothetical protein
MTESLIYDNGGVGVYVGNVAGAATPFITTLHGLTVYGNSGDGVYVEADAQLNILNCIIDTNGGYGVNATSNSLGSIYMRDCQSHSNTSGHTDINGGVLPGLGHVYEDPGFTSETDGSENLTPSNANLIIAETIAGGDGGTTYRYIGAIQPQAAAGGGGPVRRIGGVLVR